MKKKKNVAFFGIKYLPPVGGTSRVAENLIHQLKHDYNITVYCYKNKQAKNHIEGIQVIEFPKIGLGSLGVFLYFCICYWHIKFKSNYDIIHAHKIDSFFFLKGLAKKAKVVATVHGVPYKDGVWGGIAKSFFKYNEKQYLKFNGVRTAISEPLCQFYKKLYDVEVKYIPNGINLKETNDYSDMSKFWPKQVPVDSKFVLFAGRRIMGIKGLHTMLNAFKKINYQGHIFVAGDVDFNPAYIKEVKLLSTGLKVHFLGYVNPLSVLLELVNKCEYFVFPSEIEGMSMMLLEVASTGRPIVASDIPANKQVFDANEVLFFENKNVDDLADKLTWLSAHQNEFEQMGEKAQAKVTSQYTWDKIVTSYKSVYEDNS